MIGFKSRSRRGIKRLRAMHRAKKSREPWQERRLFRRMNRNDVELI